MYNLIKIMYKNLFAAKRLEPVLFLIITIALIQYASEVYAQDLTKSELLAELDRLAEQTEDKVIKWRRDIHQHPELSNREYRTSKLVAEHLQSLGMEVRTEIAHTGIVAILRGNNLSPLIALRADMDALPVTEGVDVPFASKVCTEYKWPGGGSQACLRARLPYSDAHGSRRDPLYNEESFTRLG